MLIGNISHNSIYESDFISLEGNNHKIILISRIIKNSVGDSYRFLREINHEILKVLEEFMGFCDKSFINSIWIKKNERILKSLLASGLKKVLVDTILQHEFDTYINKIQLQFQIFIQRDDLEAIVNLSNGIIIVNSKDKDIEVYCTEEKSSNFYRGDITGEYIKVNIYKKSSLVSNKIIGLILGDDFSKDIDDFKIDFNNVLSYVKDNGISFLKDGTDKYLNLDITVIAFEFYDWEEILLWENALYPIGEINYLEVYGDLKNLLERMKNDNDVFNKYIYILNKAKGEYNRGIQNFRSNMAYVFYLKKRYEEALEIYEECIRDSYYYSEDEELYQYRCSIVNHVKALLSN